MMTTSPAVAPRRASTGALTFDATDLVAGTEPQPNQGWHLRLEVEDGGVGGTKNKEFWVEVCAGPADHDEHHDHHDHDVDHDSPTTTTTTRPTTTTTTAPSGPTTTAALGVPARPSGGAVPPARPPAAGAVTPEAGRHRHELVAGPGRRRVVLVGAGLSLAVRRRLAR